MDQLQMRVERTLTLSTYLAVWLGRLPGKKNLFWLSAGFPLSAEPQTMRSGPDDRATDEMAAIFDQLQHETDARLETARSPSFPWMFAAIRENSRESTPPTFQDSSTPIRDSALRYAMT